MSVDINKRTIECPWPTCKDWDNRHSCFGRPCTHLLSEGEHHVAYPDALDTDETLDDWEDLRVTPPDK